MHTYKWTYLQKMTLCHTLLGKYIHRNTSIHANTYIYTDRQTDSNSNI